MTKDERGFAIFLVVFALFTAACSVSCVYPHDRVHPELDGWFMSLQSKGKVPCCDGSEAMRIEDADWDSKNGHYRVRLEGEWVDVPDEAVIEEPNRSGLTLVWPYYKDGKLNQVRCFVAGAGG